MHREYEKSCLPQSCIVRAWISDSLLLEASKPSGARQISAVGECLAVMNRTLHLQHDPQSGPLVNVTSSDSLRLLVAVSCRSTTVHHQPARLRMLLAFSQLRCNPNLTLTCIQLLFSHDDQSTLHQRPNRIPAFVFPGTPLRLLCPRIRIEKWQMAGDGALALRGCHSSIESAVGQQPSLQVSLAIAATISPVLRTRRPSCLADVVLQVSVIRRLCLSVPLPLQRNAFRKCIIVH